MEIELVDTSLTRHHSVFVVKVDKNEDAKFIQECLNEAEKQQTNEKDTSGKKRLPEKLLIKRYMGIASEKIVRAALKKHVGLSFERPDFESYDSHVDILTTIDDKPYTIEVRSSFPMKPLLWALYDCEGFDIIGTYTTTFKHEEIWKDLYIRVLFKMTDNMEEWGEAFTPNETHYIYIVGSADKALFDKRGYSGGLKQEGAMYKLIKPISCGYDYQRTIQLLKDKVKNNGKN